MKRIKAVDGQQVPIQVTLRTEDYRGDHAADVSIAHEVDPATSVSDLVKRLLVSERRDGEYELEVTNWIEIRVCVPVEAHDA